MFRKDATIVILSYRDILFTINRDSDIATIAQH